MIAQGLKLFINENDRNVFETPLSAVLEIGRQRAESPGHSERCRPTFFRHGTFFAGRNRWPAS